MKKPLQFILLLATTLLAAQSLFAAEPSGYYNSALGMSDEALMTALRDIIREHNEVSYSSGLLSAFRKVDTDNDGFIIDIYSNVRYKPNDNGSSASHVGEGYNREHSFPRSWFGGEVAPMNTDVFHVYPTDIKVNSQRANYPYGVCDSGTRLTYGTYVAKGKLGASTYPSYSGTVFEPDDEYKGDLARTYFYMATCYKNELPSWPGSPQLDYRTNNYKAYSTWTINMLMEWTRLDPVSEKEIKRNEGIYGIQGNRNPFIDHPELAEYIWGDLQGKPWDGSSGIVTPTITAPANGSYIDLGSTTVGTELHYTVNLKGEGLSEPLTLTITDNEYFHASAYTFTASDVNDGTSFIITFVADEADTYTDFITIGSNVHQRHSRLPLQPSSRTRARIPRYTVTVSWRTGKAVRPEATGTRKFRDMPGNGASPMPASGRITSASTISLADSGKTATVPSPCWRVCQTSQLSAFMPLATAATMMPCFR